MVLAIQNHEVLVYPVIHSEAAQQIEWLSDDERKSATRKVQPVDRAGYIACRTLLRHLLGEHLGCPPNLVPVSLSARGKPVVRQCELAFSISHSKKLSLVAVAQNRRLGIDLENLERNVDIELLSQTYLPENRRMSILNGSGKTQKERFLREWTKHEALAKASGQGLAFPAGDSLPCEVEMSVQHLEDFPGYCVAIAADGSDWQAKIVTLKHEKDHL